MYQARWLMLAIAAALALQSRGEGGIRLPDQPPKEENEGRALFGSDDHSRSVRILYLFTTHHDNSTVKKCGYVKATSFSFTTRTYSSEIREYPAP